MSMKPVFLIWLRGFLTKESYTENYTGYEYVNGKSVKVNKTRAYIIVKTKSFNDVLNGLGLTQEEKAIAINMYNSLKDVVLQTDR